jgi:hypothetical protein
MEFRNFLGLLDDPNREKGLDVLALCLLIPPRL